ncbi:GNAT family N-acetyltransferase [Variovorax sp. H27-G14]|uniref:GNAT family N-acetyltransferase n=1 Tax=Variovorax sp. H27-G14 TaxID=3111914 RepID=UPI0038FC6883
MNDTHPFPACIAAGDQMELRAIVKANASALHFLIDANKANLIQWLHWPRFVNALEDTVYFCNSCEIGMQKKTQATYGIWRHEQLAGVVSFNTIDLGNESGEIGYWLDAQTRGKGIASIAVRAMVRAFAQQRVLRRFVIKCAVANARSRGLAERLEFSREGLLSLAEQIGDTHHDQHLYALTLNDSADLPASWPL